MAPKTGMLVGVGVSVGLVVLIVVIVLAAKAGRESVGSPTDETSAAVLKKIDLNLDLSKITTGPPADGNAAEAVYQAAVKDAAALGDDFISTVLESPEPEKKPPLKSILDKLEDAADKGLGTAELNFDGSLPLTPGGEWHTREILYHMGVIATKSAASMRSDKNREGAEKAMRACLIWGDRLYKNGVYVAYKSAGLGCVSEGLAAYERHYSKDFYNDAGKLAAAKQLEDAYKETTKVWNPKEKLVRKLSPLSAPGDLWNLAEHDQDRAWQLDGLMWLGPAKWTEASAGAQRDAIQKYLEQKAGSSDPLIAKRAKAAADFTKMDIRTFHVE